MTIGQIIDGWIVSLPSDSWIVRLRLARWVLRAVIQLRSERRVCPRCTGNPKTVLEPRRRYFGRCPKCGSLWS